MDTNCTVQGWAGFRFQPGWKRKKPAPSPLHQEFFFQVLTSLPICLCCLVFRGFTFQVIAFGTLSRTSSCSQWEKQAWWASPSWPVPEMTYNLHPKHFLWAFKLICSLYVIFITLLVPSYTHFCCLSLFLNFNQKEVIHFIGLFREKTI